MKTRKYSTIGKVTKGQFELINMAKAKNYTCPELVEIGYQALVGGREFESDETEKFIPITYSFDYDKNEIYKPLGYINCYLAGCFIVANEMEAKIKETKAAKPKKTEEEKIAAKKQKVISRMAGQLYIAKFQRPDDYEAYYKVVADEFCGMFDDETVETFTEKLVPYGI